MRVRWTLEALNDLDETIAYIALDDSPAARQAAVAIKSAAKTLAALPNRGRPGFIEGTRELLAPGLPYFLVYRVRQERIEILRLMHFSQKWPRLVQ